MVADINETKITSLVECAWSGCSKLYAKWVLKAEAVPSGISTCVASRESMNMTRDGCVC